MDVERRCVEDVVGDGADGREQFALASDNFQNRAVGVERMRAARFAEPADESRVRGFEKPQRNLASGLPFEVSINLRQLLEASSLADIRDESDLRLFFRFPAQFEEF